MTAPRVLFYVQHLLGIGHLQRSLRIAEALVERGIAVTLAEGGMPVAEVGHAAGIDVVRLPPVRARDASFALVDGDGAPLGDALRGERRVRLLAAFAAAQPQALVVEGFPFARRAFRFELDPLIAAAGAAGVPVVCSVRDIPTVRADPERLAEIVGRVRRDFAAVLVHGDPRFIPFDVSFPAAAEIADRLHYTGYVAGEAAVPPGDDAAASADGRDEILVSVGGGAAGEALRSAALGACRLGRLSGMRWRILAGAGVADETLAALRQGAPANLVVERFRRDLPLLLRRCRVSVSQAGYNTVLDILAARTRAVLVPFAAERETEQSIRAERLAAAGAAELVPEADLTPARLAAAVERAARRERPTLAFDTAGAARSAALIAARIAARTDGMAGEASARRVPAI